jgi:hypothetical protein
VAGPVYGIIAGTTSVVTFLVTFFGLLDRVAGPLYGIIAGTKSRVVLVALVVAFFGALEAGNLGPADLVVSLPLGSRVRLGEESPLIAVAIVVAIIVAVVIAIIVLPP